MSHKKGLLETLAHCNYVLSNVRLYSLKVLLHVTIFQPTSLTKKKNCCKLVFVAIFVCKLHARFLHVTRPRATEFLLFEVSRKDESFSTFSNKFFQVAQQKYVEHGSCNLFRHSLSQPITAQQMHHFSTFSTFSTYPFFSQDTYGNLTCIKRCTCNLQQFFLQEKMQKIATCHSILGP